MESPAIETRLRQKVNVFFLRGCIQWMGTNDLARWTRRGEEVIAGQGSQVNIINNLEV